jgi:hypothetical protein
MADEQDYCDWRDDMNKTVTQGWKDTEELERYLSDKVGKPVSVLEDGSLFVTSITTAPFGVLGTAMVLQNAAGELHAVVVPLGLGLSVEEAA